MTRIVISRTPASICDSMAVRKDGDPRACFTEPVCVVGPRLPTLSAWVCLLIGQRKGWSLRILPAPVFCDSPSTVDFKAPVPFVFLLLPALWMMEVCEDFMCFVA